MTSLVKNILFKDILKQTVKKFNEQFDGFYGQYDGLILQIG